MTQLITRKQTLEKIAELGWREEKTRDYIKRELQDTPLWEEKTALIYSIGKGTPVFFRAELDGLQTTAGVKHVCGHAAHLASLMGAYEYFTSSPPAGFQIYFVFQPCEEGFPSGAQFISDSFPEIKKCRMGFAFHAFPSEKTGELINPVFASGDYFEIKFEGKGTHIKNKYLPRTTDALLLASKLAQTINKTKKKDFLINAGTLTAGETPNSIAGNALVTGDVRALTDTARAAAEQWIRTEVAKLQKTTSVKISLLYSTVYPILKNNKRAIQRLEKILPVKKKLTSFATEDFSLLPTEKIFLLVGTGEKQDLHEVAFTFPEKALEKLYGYWITLGENLQEIIEV